jgi:hypothetical protein
VAWEPIDGAAAATNSSTYELQIRESTSPTWTTISASLSGNVAKKKNLNKASSYHFRVKPNEAGWTYSLSNNVPFKPVSALAPIFRDLFGSTLVMANGTTKSVDKLAGCVIGIYFSASWWYVTFFSFSLAPSLAPVLYAPLFMSLW